MNSTVRYPRFVIFRISEVLRKSIDSPVLLLENDLSAMLLLWFFFPFNCGFFVVEMLCKASSKSILIFIKGKRKAGERSDWHHRRS